MEIRNNFSAGPVASRGCFTSGINHGRARECEWAEPHGTTTVHHKFDTCSLWWLGWRIARVFLAIGGPRDFSFAKPTKISSRLNVGGETCLSNIMITKFSSNGGV